MKIIHCADLHLGSKIEAKFPKTRETFEEFLARQQRYFTPKVKKMTPREREEMELIKKREIELIKKKEMEIKQRERKEIELRKKKEYE